MTYIFGVKIGKYKQPLYGLKIDLEAFLYIYIFFFLVIWHHNFFTAFPCLPCWQVIWNKEKINFGPKHSGIDSFLGSLRLHLQCAKTTNLFRQEFSQVVHLPSAI
jgi:hypothetical protein